MRIEPLAEMEFAYTTEFFLVRPYGTEEGSGYGEGNGRIRGERISGELRWVNHPRRRSDSAMLPNTDGLIRTEDGASILFNLEGRTVWSEDRTRGGQSLVFRFEAEDERYRWLNDLVVVAEGTVDPKRLVVTARLFTVINELIENPPEGG